MRSICPLLSWDPSVIEDGPFTPHVSLPMRIETGECTPNFPPQVPTKRRSLNPDLLNIAFSFPEQVGVLRAARARFPHRAAQGGHAHDQHRHHHGLYPRPAQGLWGAYVPLPLSVCICGRTFDVCPFRSRIDAHRAAVGCEYGRTI